MPDGNPHVQSSADRATFGRLGLVTLALVFVIGAAVINLVFRGLKVDLTENNLYTLSEGTRNVLGKIPEPINVYLFFSDKATADIPFIRTYAGRVREVLEEFQSRSNGKLTLKVIDPLPFSEDEDRAAQFGLQPINLGGTGEPIYLGVAGTNSVGDNQTIAFLDPNKESFLEYDLAKLVYSLANPKKPVIGLLAGLPMLAGFDPMTQQMREPWVIAEQLRQLFDLKVIEPGASSIDPAVKVLVVVHPKDLADGTLNAIDQFVLKGGRAIFFVDPLAEVDQGNPQDPASMAGGKSSNLDKLLNAWGVSVDSKNIIGDDKFALTVGGGNQRPIRALGYLGIDAGGLDQNDVITAGLDVINLGYAGHLTLAKGSAVKIEPLIQSSDAAALIGTERLAFMPDPDALRDGFAPTGTRYVLAGRITGNVKSAFPASSPDHIATSREPINVVVVADTDMLSDRLWVQTANFFGQRVNQAFAKNGDFVVNAVDNLLGSNDLISIRSRATFSRPFERVLDLRREAESQFRMTEQTLQQELRDTESKLTQLQASRSDQNAMILTPEQQAEIQRFQDRRLEIRKELRQVRRGLDSNIEGLGTVLKVINIGLVPVLILTLSIVLWLRRRSSARRHSEAKA